MSGIQGWEWRIELRGNAEGVICCRLRYEGCQLVICLGGSDCHRQL